MTTLEKDSWLLTSHSEVIKYCFGLATVLVARSKYHRKCQLLRVGLDNQRFLFFTGFSPLYYAALFNTAVQVYFWRPWFLESNSFSSIDVCNHPKIPEHVEMDWCCIVLYISDGRPGSTRENWEQKNKFFQSQYSHISSQLTIKSLVFPFQQCPVYPLISKL